MHPLLLWHNKCIVASAPSTGDALRTNKPYSEHWRELGSNFLTNVLAVPFKTLMQNFSVTWVNTSMNCAEELISFQRLGIHTPSQIFYICGFFPTDKNCWNLILEIMPIQEPKRRYSNIKAKRLAVLYFCWSLLKRGSSNPSFEEFLFCTLLAARYVKSLNRKFPKDNFFRRNQTLKTSDVLSLGYYCAFG